MDDSVLVERRGGVLRVMLNRPAQMNAVTAGMGRALLDALEGAGTDPGVRAVLLLGAGRGFCAGQDLAEVTPEMDLGEVLGRVFNPIVLAIRGMPKPVVCAVQGVAAGAGANVALACDVVLAGQAARFVQAFVRIGLVPDAGGSWLLPRLAGEARARGMAMLGEPVGAAQAEAWGMIWRTVPDEALVEEAEALATRLASMPTQALGLMKRAFAAGSANGLEAQLELERALQREAGGTADFREGVRAFLEKRPARFTGGAG